MFWKFGKKQETQEIDTAAQKEVAEKKMTTDNILEVFSKDMMREKKKELQENLAGKDQVYYIGKLTLAFKSLFFLFLFISITLTTYSYIQKNEEASDLWYFDSICWIFLGTEAKNLHGSCGSLASVKKEYDERIDKVKDEQAQSITNLLDRVYALDNFLFTEDISFLLEKSSAKLPVTKMLQEFSQLKDAFVSTKWVYTIECSEVALNNNWEMILSCTAYTSDWSDSNIIWFNGQITGWNKISWTSITVASSFINYIKNQANEFKILEATNLYSFSDNIEEWKERYTKSTDFELTLKYTNPLAQ